MDRSRDRRLGVPGVLEHVAAARVLRADGSEIDSFSRGLGRNRVAVLIHDDLQPGEALRFEIAVEGGVVTGRGTLAWVHVAPRVAEDERWAVIDVERFDARSTARLLRHLFAQRYTAPAALPHRLGGVTPPPPAPPRAPDTQPKARPRPPDPQPKARPRPRIERYAAPEVPSRFRVR